MKFFLRQLELIFTVAGLAVIFGVAAVFTPSGMSHWRVAAITAALVGVIHGVLFWLVRRRQREARRAAIADLQWMLQDIINNQLAVIETMATLREARPAEAQRACGYISRSVRTISEALNHLSEESLQKWQDKYSHREADRTVKT